MSSPEVPARLRAVRASTAALLSGIEGQAWTDADMRAASLLPGWSRGHVLTHIARNADGITRTLQGALRGERVPRYPNGPEGRNADIEAGSSRSAAELLADLHRSTEDLDATFTAVEAAGAWDAQADEPLARDYLVARWREVEIHHVDAAGAYRAQDWPAPFVAYLLPYLLEDLPRRLGGPIRLVAGPGSTSPLAGQEWQVGAGTGAGTGTSSGGDLIAPDWALCCWLVGRPVDPPSLLAAAPRLDAWR